MNLVAYKTKAVEGWELEPASKTRDWMEDTTNRFAYRCLPLVMANQAGWIIRSPVSFSVRWNGRPTGAKSMKFKFAENPELYEKSITSHFGYGIVSFIVPYLFRTEPGVSLLVRGLPNWPKFNCTPLEGLVETDWSPFSFTVNWKIHLPLWPVKFNKGDPICFIQPFMLGALEEIQPRIEHLQENCELEAEHKEWCAARKAFNSDPARGSKWQKHYFKGTHYHGKPAESHRTTLKVRNFTCSPENADRAV